LPQSVNAWFRSIWDFLLSYARTWWFKCHRFIKK